MTVFIFAGPTLAAVDGRAFCDAVFLPPAALGDVYRVGQSRPRAIGIIDGYFDGVPSVWHKEILWAMAEGIHLFGSASMGALRAAELCDFGMRGVGTIFEGYRNGTLQDDDEVALLHGPKEAGYLALSEPMVNIRATLARAADEDVVGVAARSMLEAAAKALFYQERTWENLFEATELSRVPAAELDALRSWLPTGRVDVKRADAIAMLSAMATYLQDDPAPMRPTYHLEWTEMWDRATSFAASGDAHTMDLAGDVPLADLVDEARLQTDTAEDLHHKAFLRLLAQREADRRHASPDNAAINETTNEFREQHQLFTRKSLDRWIDAHGLNQQEFERLMREEAQIQSLRTWARPVLDKKLVDTLRLGGSYRALLERASRKQKLLDDVDLGDRQAVGPNPLQLLTWYCRDRLGRAIPDDPEGFGRSLGFSNRDDFDRALLREYLYSKNKDFDGR